METAAVVNVHDGGLNNIFRADDDAKIFHQGGRTETIFLGEYGIAELSGGAIETIGARESSALTIKGVNFAIDGVPVSGLDQVDDTASINLPAGSVLTAILADGTPFGRVQQTGAQATTISDGVLTLQRSVDPLPPPIGTVVIDTTSGMAAAGAEQIVQVVENGRLQEQFRAGSGSRIEVNGGRIDAALHAIGAEVVLNDGSIGRRLKAFDGALVEVNGGRFDGDTDIYRNSAFNIRGGEAGRITGREDGTINVFGGNLFSADLVNKAVFNITGGTTQRVSTGSGRINLLGGSIVDSIDVADVGGVVEFAGGRHTDNVSVRAGGQAVVRGSEFRVNGVQLPIVLQPGETTSVDLTEDTTFSGVYADGTPFVFHGKQEDIRSAITVVETPVAALGPSLIRVPSDPVPHGLRSGQTLVLTEGGEIPDNFTAGEGSTLFVQGGNVGFNLEAIGATISATGGEFSTIDGFNGSVINLGGEAVWRGLDLFSGAVATISGGQYTGGHFFRVVDNATVNISGGEFRGVIAVDGARANISGGDLEGFTLDRFSVGLVSGGNFSGGLTVRSGSQLVLTGGDVPGVSASLGDSNLQGIATTRVQVAGASVGSLVSHEESLIEVFSGTVDELGNLGGTTRFFGGALGDSHNWLSGVVDIHGYDFQVDGTPIAGLDQEGDSLEFNYTSGTTISGILSDGTPFNLTPNDNFNPVNIFDGVLTLRRSDIPDLPSDVVVNDQQAPHGAAAGQNVTVEEGGVLRDNFVAGPGSVVEIRGGQVGHNFEADRSNVTILGGEVGEHLDVFHGATLTVSGGSIGRDLEVHEGGTLEIRGGQVEYGGKALGGTVNMDGGKILSSFQAVDGASVNISGGMIDGTLTVGENSNAIVSGGEVRSVRVEAGGTATIEGGKAEFDTREGSTLVITGGIILNGSQARPDSTVEVSGGSFGDNLSNYTGDKFSIAGTDFEIDGVAIEGLDQIGAEKSIVIESGKLFTGSLSDGTPFAFTSRESDDLRTVRLVRSFSPTPGPTEINVPVDTAPYGVRGGHTLNLNDGGTLPENFGAGRDSVVNILGGTVERNFEAYFAEVNIEGGMIGSNFDAFSQSKINISGGKIGSNFDAHSGSEINMTNGSIEQLQAFEGSSVILQGGHIFEMHTNSNSLTAWKGGTIGTLRVDASSKLDVYGFDFKVNGNPLYGLRNEGDLRTFNLPANAILTAVLSDGTPLILGPFLTQQQISNDTLTLHRSALPDPQQDVFFQIDSSDAPHAIGAHQSLVLLDGGQLPANFIAGNNAHVEVQGGEILENFRAFESKVEIASGSIGRHFRAFHGAEVLVTGGEFDSNFSIHDGAQLTIKGGVFPTGSTIHEGAIVDIFGTSFLIDSEPIPQLTEVGDIFQLSDFSDSFLTAFLPDGSELYWRLFEGPSNPRKPSFGISSGATIRLHLVPEPSSFVMAMTCVILLSMRSTDNGRISSGRTPS